MPINDQSLDDRVRIGKTVESQILEQIVAAGMNCVPATKTEDIHHKVDAWWKPDPHTKKGIQIKYRETGDDILFEVQKDWDTKTPGRDMKSRSDYYVTANRQGKGYLISVEELKDKVEQALEENTMDQLQNGVMLRVRTDAQHGQKKCIAFIQPQALGVLRTFQFTLSKA